MTELADIINRVVRRPVAFDSVSEEAFVQICQVGNEPEVIISTLLSMYRAVENRRFEEVTDDVLKLTGKPPESIAAFLCRSIVHAAGP